MNVASAQVDHYKLEVGLYLQEVQEVGNILLYVYDLRMVKPNDCNIDGYDGMRSPVVHSIEHLLAWNLRKVAVDAGKSASDIISVYPYGCTTGMGCISLLSKEEFAPILKKAIEVSLDATEIPFADPQLCGNYHYQDLRGAKHKLKRYYDDLEDVGWSVWISPRIE